VDDLAARSERFAGKSAANSVEHAYTQGGADRNRKHLTFFTGAAFHPVLLDESVDPIGPLFQWNFSTPKKGFPPPTRHRSAGLQVWLALLKAA